MLAAILSKIRRSAGCEQRPGVKFARTSGGNEIYTGFPPRYACRHASSRNKSQNIRASSGGTRFVFQRWAAVKSPSRRLGAGAP